MQPRKPSAYHRWDGSKWVLDLDKLKAEKRAEIAQKRWEAETGGIIINGVTIATDRESQSLLTAAVLKSKDDTTYTVNWKAKNGWFTLDASTLESIADAVRLHVQNCFDKEKQIQELIDSATTVDEIEAIIWDSV